MDMNLDSIIDTIAVLRETEEKYYHNSLGIKDERSLQLMELAENIIYDYLESESDDWQVEDIISDLLWACKFHAMKSTEILYFMCYGYNFLASHIEPIIFEVGEGAGYVKGDNINPNPN